MNPFPDESVTIDASGEPDAHSWSDATTQTRLVSNSGTKPAGNGDEAVFLGTERFAVQRVLGAGGTGVVYEVLDRERDTRVALKALRVCGGQAIMRLKREFRALQDLLHPNLIRLGELYEDNGKWFFTMELIEGVDFLAYVRPPELSQTNEPVDFVRLRDSVRQLALGLGYLHDAGKVHLDIKPANVQVTGVGRVVLLDFSIMFDLHRDTPDGLTRSGTVAFMSPEQSRGESVTPASDWYCVGVMLYQALTGRRPFVGSAQAILERKRRGERPLPPHTYVPDLPRFWSTLCMDLLAPNAEDRPTSCEVLEQIGYDSGEFYGCDNVSASGSLFLGREGELALLQSAYEQRQAGCARIVLIRGEAGIGKSALVYEFIGYLGVSQPQALVLSGRCYERESVPYKAVDEVIDGLARHLLRLEPEVRQSYLPEGMDALATLFPVLQEFVGTSGNDQHTTASTELHNLRSRAFAALRELLHLLSQRRRVVWVIDDLHWGDADSMDLLTEVLAPPDAPTILLIGTVCPDSNTSSSGADMEWLRARLAGEVRIMDLGPLPMPTAAALVYQLMAQRDTEHLVDAERIALDARGNPLFISALVHHQLTEAQYAHPRRLDEAIWQQVAHLDSDRRRLIEAVSVAGGPISQYVLALALAVSEGRLVDLIAPLRAVRLVRTDGVHADDQIAPYHDRIREAVLAHMDLARRTEWHHALATALEVSDRADSALLAMHWHGAGDSERAFDYAQVAAEQATLALAFDRAARMYRLALALVPASLWHRDYIRALNLHCDAADAGLRCLTPAWIDDLFDTVSAHARTLTDTTRIHEARIHAALAKEQPEQAVRYAAEILDQLGVRIPRKPTAWHVLRSVLKIQLRLGRRDPATLSSLPVDTDRRREAAMRILSALASTAYLGDPLLNTTLMLQMIHLCLKHGNTCYSPVAYASYGAFLGSTCGARHKARGFGQLSRRMAARSAIDEQALKIELLLQVYVEPWWQPLRVCEESLYRSWHRATAQAHSKLAIWLAGCGFSVAMVAGIELEQIEARYEPFFAIMATTRGDFTLDAVYPWYQMLMVLRGDGSGTPTSPQAWRTLGADALEDRRTIGGHIVVGYVHLARAVLALFFRDLAHAQTALQQARPWLKELAGSYVMPLIHLCEQLICLGLAARAGTVRAHRLCMQSALGRFRFREWAHCIPVNYMHRYRLIEAELCSVRGQDGRAEKLYQTAARGAKANGYIHEAALAWELYAEHLVRRGQMARIGHCLEHARDLYQAWGAAAKVADLLERYPEYLNGTA